MRMRIARPLILNNIVSPFGISILSTMIFLIAWCFPTHFYSELVHEPDLMFLDPTTLLFFLLCVAGFWAGLLLVNFLFPSRPLLETQPKSSPCTGLSLILPLTVTTVMTVLTCILIIRETPNLLVLLLSQQGQTAKSQLAEMKLGLLGWGAAIQTPVLWWTYWRLRISKSEHIERNLRYLKAFYWVIFVIGLFAQVAFSVLRVSRSDIMPVFAGIAVLYLMSGILRREIKTAGVFRYILLLSMAVILLFVLFSLLRGTSNVYVGLTGFAGYTIASYNRLAALLHGTMRYPYGGHGVYLFPFLNSNHVLNTFLPMKGIFGWPDSFELWHSEFQAPQLAGLNDYLIWSSAFGYIFADVGWATPVLLAAYGVVYGLVWRQAKSGNVLGLTLYPWFAFSALAWFSGNLVFDATFPFLIVTGLLLIAYERLLT